MFLDIHWFYDMLILRISSNSVISTTNESVDPWVCTIMRIIRLIGSIRITKFYNYSDNADFRDIITTQVNPSETSLIYEKSLKRMEIAKTFADYSMRKIIILVIVMITGIIMLDANFYYRNITSYEYGLKNFNNYSSVNDPSLIIGFQAYTLTHQVNYFADLS